MQLTNEQLASIRNYIRSNGITIATLEDDLLDHLSCEIREQDGEWPTV